MAFELAERKFKKANDIPVGSSVEGYVVGKYNGGKFPKVDCLMIKEKDGTEYILSGNGTLKYFFENGNQVGLYYRFTRKADQLNKMKQTVSQWTIEVDRSLKTEVTANIVDIPSAAETAGIDSLEF